MKELKNTLSIGANIAKLRIKKGLTQAQLADELYISNKTISKWERGTGYPEITQLPALAHILNTYEWFLCNQINLSLLI